MKTAPAFLCLVIFWPPGPALAGGPELDLAECLRLADANHPTLAAARQAVAAAGQSVAEARAPWWPQVDLGAGYHRWQRRAFLPAGLFPAGRSAPELIGPLDDWNAGVTARATLFDFGSRRAGVEAARARLDSTEADAATTRAELRLAVRRAYFAVAAAVELREVAARNLARAEAGQRLAEARNRSGAVPLVDVLRSQAEVAAARLEVIAAESRVRTASGRLNASVGRPAETEVAVASGGAGEVPAMDAALALPHALEHRPELLAARHQVAAADAVLRGARAARAPHVRADGAFGVRDVDFVPESREWQAGVSVDVPLFDGGARRSRVARAAAEKARAEALMAALELRIREEVWAALAEKERACAALAASESLLRESEEAMRVTRARYEAGGALVTDLLSTQAGLAAAEAGLAAARWDLRTAEAVFLRATAGEAAAPGARE